MLSIKSLDAALQVAAAGRDRGIVEAPVTGTVLDVSAQVGEAPMGSFLRLAETGELAVLAEVYEADVRFVKVGQSVTITGDALERPLHGVVERVGRTIRQNQVYSLDPAARTDSRVVEVRIALKDATIDDPGALVDLQVEARIDTGPIALDGAGSDAATPNPAVPDAAPDAPAAEPTGQPLNPAEEPLNPADGSR